MRGALASSRHDVVASRLFNHDGSIEARVITHSDDHADQDGQHDVMKPMLQSRFIALNGKPDRAPRFLHVVGFEVLLRQVGNEVLSQDDVHQKTYAHSKHSEENEASIQIAASKKRGDHSHEDGNQAGQCQGRDGE